MKPRGRLQKILSVILALAIVLGVSPLAYAQSYQTGSTGQKLSFEKVEGTEVDARLPDTEVTQTEEASYAATDSVRISIVLEKQPTLELYSTMNIAQNASAMAYSQQLKQEQEILTAKIERQALQGESLDVVWNMTLAANIISADVDYGKIEAIEAVAGVAKVVIENQYDPMVVSSSAADPQMATSSQMIGTSAVWAAGFTGAGSRIAVIDTGIDTDHQSFSNDGYLYALEQNALEKEMELGAYMQGLDLLDKAEIASVLEDLNIYEVMDKKGLTADTAYINEKIPFGLNYVDRSFDATHDNDSMGGHGSHVAGIATANRYIPNGAGGYDNALEKVYTQGVAPDAQVIVMKVFGKGGGAYDSDYMVAIEDAIILGCDAVNLSLGSDRGFTRSELYQDILDSLEDSDAIVAIAAGNSGSWPEYSASGVGYLRAEDVDLSMLASPAAATNSLAVASVENIGATDYYIAVGQGEDRSVIFYQTGTRASKPIPALTTLAGAHSYILIDGIGTADEVAAVVANEGGSIAEGCILVCARGEINFSEKANNAGANGFAGIVVYNNQPGVINMNLDDFGYDIPGVSVTQSGGNSLRDAAEPVYDDAGQVLYYRGTMDISDSIAPGVADENYSMSTFSSWGVPSSLLLKPEITAPGGNIYSVDGAAPGGTAYMNNSGTSMATPQVAGMVAIMSQYVKEAGLLEKTDLSARQLITSLLMATAQPMTDATNGGSYYPVLQQGAGLANVSNAMQAGSYILMDESATSGAADGKVKAELGDDPQRAGSYKFSFTLNNFSDESRGYSLSGTLFTQGVFTSEGTCYLDTLTTTLGASVSFTVDGKPLEMLSAGYACDLNDDSVTDELDAQCILDHVAGILETVAPAADVDQDGRVTSYDAHLLLTSLESGTFRVLPGQTATIGVAFQLTDDAKAELDANYPSGAYVEGFVTVHSTSNVEGVQEPDYSIPVLGFYGNWSDSSMFDQLDYTEYLYGDETIPYSGGIHYLSLFEGTNEYYWTGNPYIVEDTFPVGREAINSTTEVGDMVTTLIRNAGGFMFYILDGQGNVVETIGNAQVRSAFYYINGGAWTGVNSAGLNIWTTPSAMGFQEDDVFTIGFMAVPEYYEKNGELTTQQMVNLMESGELGEGVYHSYTFTVDDTAPELFSVTKNAETGNLEIDAQDNQYIAAVAVLNASGSSILSAVVPEQTDKGQRVEVELDMSEVADRIGANCMVLVADYAGNETLYKLTYNEDSGEYAGKMYGFTNVATRGTANSWLEMDPTGLYYYTTGSTTTVVHQGGTDEKANMPWSVTAGEYVGGYVFMATSTGELWVAQQGDWESAIFVASDSRYATMKDMARHPVTGELYVLGANNTVYTVDLSTGALETQYTVALANPRSPSGTAAYQLLTMTIDDAGNFYAINDGAGSYQNVFLYTWTNEQVADGEVTNLAPINDDRDGYAGPNIYSTGTNNMGVVCTQSMAWDHDKDILYWSSAMNNVSLYNTLYTFDLTTGKAVPATESVVGVSQGISTLGGNMSALYIVPASGGVMEPEDEATGVELDREEVTLLPTAELQINANVYPWNLADHSLRWSSDNETVATVDENGVITALDEGTATITVTTNAAPNLTDTCVVYVEPVENVALSALVYGTGGKATWAEFDLTDADAWQTVYSEPTYQFAAGTLLDDVLFVHDRNHMYGVDADSFQVTDYGIIDPTWQWTDAAPAPLTEEGYFGRIVGILNSGRYLAVMDVTQGVGTEISMSNNFNKDPMAAIAYVGPTTYTDQYGSCPAYEYYVITERGELWSVVVFTFEDNYDCVFEYVGSTGLRLSGVSNVSGNKSASMYYDSANDYLIVSSYQSGAYNQVYVFQPDACAPVEMGNFGADIWPVTTLYQYTRITELTVKVKPVKATIYDGESVSLNAKVYPVHEYEGGVTWSSSDEQIATVDANGLVTAHSPGTVTITATSVAVNDNGDHASDSAVITVMPLKTLSTDLHAHMTTEEGSAWVVINGEDMSYEILAESDARYTGAAVSEGKIYATDDHAYYMIDPASGAYTVTEGADYIDEADCLYILDGAGAPKRTVELLDFGTNEYFDAEVGGYPVYISGYDDNGYYYLTTLQDYQYGDYGVIPISHMYAPAAITYLRSETVADGYNFDFFLILGYDGTLETYSVYTGFANGVPAIAGGYEEDTVALDIEFSDGDDLSMTAVETEDFYGVVISHAGENGTDFYLYDLNNQELTKMGNIPEAIDLVGLSTAEEVGVVVQEPDEPVDPSDADHLLGYLAVEDGYLWAKIDPADMHYETLATDTQNYTAAGVSEGMIYAAYGVSKYGMTTNYYYQIDPANGYAATQGITTPGFNYTMADGAGAPAKTVSLVDAATGEYVEVNVGGYFAHISNGQYSSSAPKLYVLKDFAMGDYTEMYTSSSTFSSKLAAVTYVSGEISGDKLSYKENFLILGQDGKLYNCQFTTTQSGLNSSAAVTAAGTLELTPTDGASMARIDSDTVMISVNGDDGVTLYKYALSTATLTQIGVLEEAVSLVGLSLYGMLSGEIVEPEDPVDPEDPIDPEDPTIPAPELEDMSLAVDLHAYIGTEKGNAWATINTGDMHYKIRTDLSSTSYSGGGVSGGVIYASDEGTTGKYYRIDPASGYISTTGASFATGRAILDGTHVARTPIDIYDAYDQEVITMYAGNFFAYVTSDRLALLRDYQSGPASYQVGGIHMRAVVHLGVHVEDTRTYYEDYLVLSNEGKLYKVTLKATSYEETLSYQYDSCSLYADLSALELSGGKVSMAWLDDGANYGLMISDADVDNGVRLYFYDMDNQKLGFLGEMEGVYDLIGLSTAAELGITITPDVPGESDLPKPELGATSMDLSLHGYVTTSDNLNAWTEISTSTMTHETQVEPGWTVYTGAGVSQGEIIAGDEVGFYVIEPSNKYATTIGVDTPRGYTMVDATGIPSDTVNLSGAAGEQSVSVGGYVAYVTGLVQKDNTAYVVLLEDTEVTNRLALPADCQTPGAVAWVKSQVDPENPAAYNDTLMILGTEGVLYECTLVNTLEDTYQIATRMEIEAVADLSDMTLSGGKLTMTLINDGTQNGLLIAATKAVGVVFYFYDLDDGTLSALGTLSNAAKLIGLSTMAELGTGKSVDAFAGPTFLTGSLMSVRNAAEPASVVVDENTVVTENGSVTVKLREDEAVTNGLMEITYDPAALTFAGATSSHLHAINSAEAGKLLVTYAAEEAIGANEVLAVLKFSYENDYVNTIITVKTLERNENLEVFDEERQITVTQEDGGHNYEHVETLEPTCTADGYKRYTCSKCGDTYTEPLEATGHDYEAQVTEPTCTAMGYTTYTCHCGNAYIVDLVEPTGHDFAARITEPTCTAMGYTTYTCHCGETYKSDYVAPTGHSFGDWQPVTEPGCESEGLEMRTCACGEAEYRDTDPTGHSYSAEVVAPSCTEMGYTVYTCACGHSYKTDYLNPTGHSYTAVVTAPTCTEMGYTTYTCACGETYKSDYVAPTGHSFGDWTMTKEATCTESGVETRTCICGETETREIPAKCPAGEFTDVDTSRWYHEGVDYVLKNSLMKGKDQGIFAPNATLTRGELVTVLYRMAGEPSVEGLENPFLDVEDGRYYTNAVIWAANNGIVKGMDETSFAPNAAITREQIATILFRHAGAGAVEENALADFTDADAVSAYAADAMNWAVGKGLIKGLTNGTLASRETATRAQIATILMRYRESTNV